MKSLLQIIIKVWIQQFYQRNAGFFLFLFVVLFGVVQNPLSYHVAIMRGIVSSYTTLLIAMFAWLLYSCKCLVFVFKALAAKENIFLCQLQTLAATRLLPLLGTAHTILFLPATVYILFTIGIGLYAGYFVPAVLLVLFLLIVHAAGILLYHQRLMYAGTQSRLLRFNFFSFRVPKKFYSWLMWYNLYAGKLKAAAVKFFSLLMLFIPLVWNSDHFEFSDFIIFFQVSIAAHAVIVYDGVRFLEKDFRVLRNMPLPLSKIFALFIITFIILLLPEAFILLYYSHSVALTVPAWALSIYSIGQLLLYTALCYEKGMKIESYMLYVGLITVLSLLLAPLKSFAAAGFGLLVIAFIIFSSLYYSYEPEYDNKEKD